MPIKQSKRGGSNRTIYVADPAMWDRARQLAENKDLSMSELIGQLLRAWIDQKQD
jgi:hypothetical protein